MKREGLITLQMVLRQSGGCRHGSRRRGLGGSPARGRPGRIPAPPVNGIGRPSRLTVDIPSVDGIVVKGTAMPQDPPRD
ncbi:MULTISPECIES: hypothetical protein [Aphanothece]|uniref:hypothetical protein n=1 Tax=Aphanothece TaxID=1121 RepID=UPI003984779A